eukprot:jgi/Astpho2/3380/Aster-04720
MDEEAKRDLKELMQQRAVLEGKLAEHTARLQAAGVGMRDSLTDKDGPALLRPFAVVDEVAEGSPAGQAGIAVGDQMLRFAGVQAQPSALQAVAAALQANAGRTVQAEFLRQGRLVQSDAMMGKPSSLLAHALLLLSTQQHQKDAQDIPAWLWMLAPVFWLFPATLQLAAFFAAMQCIFSKHLSELLARLEDHAYGMTPDPDVLWGPPVKPARPSARPSQEPVLPAIYEELELCSDDDSVSELGSFATSSHMCDSPPSVFQFD